MQSQEMTRHCLLLKFGTSLGFFFPCPGARGAAFSTSRKDVPHLGSASASHLYLPSWDHFPCQTGVCSHPVLVDISCSPGRRFPLCSSLTLNVNFSPSWRPPHYAASSPAALRNGRYQQAAVVL